MNQSIEIRKPVALPVLVTAAGLLAVAGIAYALRTGVISLWPVSRHELVNFTFTMQMLELGVSSLAIAFTYFYNRDAFKTFFRLKISFSQDDEWTAYGPIVAIGFTLGTVMMMSMNVASQHGAVNETFITMIPLVLLMAATNAWSEEMISRLVIVAGLHERVSSSAICGISAGLFGLAHFYGTPSGVFGVIASGALGWFLARSMVETKGMGWALLIHFLQDVVIFGAGAMVLAGNQA